MDQATADILKAAQESAQRMLDDLQPTIDDFTESMRQLGTSQLSSITANMRQLNTSYVSSIAEAVRQAQAIPYETLADAVRQSLDFTPKLAEAVRQVQALPYERLAEAGRQLQDSLADTFQGSLRQFATATGHRALQLPLAGSPLSDRVALPEGPAPAVPSQRSDPMNGLLRQVIHILQTLHAKHDAATDASTRRDMAQLVVALLALILAVVALMALYGPLPAPK